MQLHLILLLAAVVVVVLFALQNSVNVTVVFFLWRADASLAVVLTICVGIGALLSALATLPNLVRYHLDSRRQQRRIEELERVLEEQRRSPETPSGTATPSAVDP
jgi:putative membrane protein